MFLVIDVIYAMWLMTVFVAPEFICLGLWTARKCVVKGVINPLSFWLHMSEERKFCWGAWGRQEAALSACPCDRFRGLLSRMETSGGQSLCEAGNKTALYKNRPNGNHRWQERAASIWKWAQCSQTIYLMGSCSQMGGDFLGWIYLKTSLNI